jgi:Protein of unknown function (DUF1592)/Protein of unknown function (DUF1588)/Protein of unknown function (DUF1587)/Protein of unknown function (DUF1585)/Protein of unknown function (DUF1595)
MRNKLAAVPLIALGTLIAVGQSSRPAPPSQSTSRPAAEAKAVQPSASFESAVQPFLAKNCYGCHNQKLSSGKLDLTAYKTRASVASDTDRWDLILRRLTAGEMPPQPMSRPNAAELHAATEWIEGELDRVNLAHPDPGRVTARRLNRSEYNSTVKDLLGVDFRPADEFPQDDTGYGFDTIGDVLSLSIVQMEKYLSAAETVARTAVYGPQDVKPTMARYQPPGRRRPGDFDNLFFNTHPWLSVTNYDESGLSMPNAFHVIHRFPVTAEYVIRATPDNGSRPPGSEPLEVAAFVDGKVVGTSTIDGQLEGKTQEFRTRITAGEHWIAVGFPRQFEGLPVLYGAKNPSKRPVPVGGRRGGGGGGRGGLNGVPGGGAGLAGASGGRGPTDATAALTGAPPGSPGLTAPPGAGRGGAGGRGGANAANNNDDAVSNVFFTPPGAPPGTRLSRPDNMGLQSLEIGGPNNPEVRPSPESVKNILICDLHAVGCDRTIITNLAHRAYRRPVTPQEVDELVAQMARVKQRGDSSEEQLVVGIEAILVSPNFLFRIEKDHVAKPSPVAAKPSAVAKLSDSYYLNDFELASRLSYFLWSSMPDDELLRIAERGTLRRPEVIESQVRRMLADPKISRLVENFGGQWLQFRGLESHQPDFYLYPAFDSYLRNSMTQETQLFFENLIKGDRNILDFLDADYTFVNEYLGQYYGLRDVKGPEFRKVSLANTPRRGILGQASMLTMSSYGNRTSVVLRGKWVLDNLLNMPPPPAPPNVPDLEQTKIGADATLRQRMEVHRDNAVCASCHSKMDPIGFGLENFDATGNWREKEGKSPIDASGKLPDGRTFNGPVELAKLLRSQKDAFAQCMAEKMMIFALGRGLEAYDRPALKKIGAGVSAGQYRFSSLVLEIVKSLPFQMRKGERPL